MAIRGEDAHMTKAEIIDNLATLLVVHYVVLREDIHQEPYKRAIFYLFVEACRTGIYDDGFGYLTADAMAPMLIERGVASAQDDKLIGEVLTMWSEWTYAWKNLDALITARAIA
jgi:hypothetical protein